MFAKRLVLATLVTLGMAFGSIAITGTASAATHHGITWHAVIVKCNHSHNCRKHIPAGIRHSLGIGSHPARWFVGDTSVIYVKYGNHVKRFTS